MIHYLKNKVGVVDFANAQGVVMFLLHFVAFFHVASLLSTGVDNKKVGVDYKKALELDNRIFFFIFQPDFNLEISTKNATKHPVA